MRLRAVPLLLLLLAAAAVAAGVACGNSADPAHPSDEKNADGNNNRSDNNVAELVIPPIGADAGALIASDHASSREPADTRASLQIPARDPRIAKRRPRSRALVLTEVNQLEKLLDATQATAPDRPVLRRRIAESYNELAMTSSGPDAARARGESIKQYTAIKDDYPNFNQIDEVLYYLGLAYEQNGDRTNARRMYYDLIRRQPSSKLIPFAYFAFGELFFTEAAADATKNDLAAQAFTEVMKYPAPTNPLIPDTMLRLGQTFLRQKEDAKAKVMLERLQHDFPESSAAAQAPHTF